MTIVVSNLQEPKINYLKKYDRMKAAIKQLVHMPDYHISLLIRFLKQNNGVLSKRAKGNEFKTLTAKEYQQIEKLYATIFKK